MPAENRSDPHLSAVRARAAFEAAFRKSRRRNLWREYDGLILTVFARRDGAGYGWCVSGPEWSRFSPDSYQTERAALGALWDELREDEP
jgi:hypothetical protein